MVQGSEGAPVWNLDAARWGTLVRRARGADALEDGAYVRAEAGASGAPELAFYATALNKPAGWNYPFLEAVPDADARGALVGRAWHQPETGFVQFEVSVIAAAQALAADYESGASDLDFVTYEQAVERAVRGTPQDLAWLHREFARLDALTG
jgi:hypothetical protein